METIYTEEFVRGMNSSLTNEELIQEIVFCASRKEYYQSEYFRTYNFESKRREENFLARLTINCEILRERLGK